MIGGAASASALESPLLELERVGKRFGSPECVDVLEGIDLRVCAGEFVCLIGESGCGKSTLLRLIAGLQAPSAGSIRLGGVPLTGPDGRVLLVFQEYGRSLLPWRSVQGNVEFGLESRGVPRAERAGRAAALLEMVGLSEFRRHHPWQLSGGMQQRVALARALVCEPSVLLLDEPFGSLDAYTRQELEDLLLALWERVGQTIVLVTHDMDEAIYLGERVVVLGGRPGRVRAVEEVGLERPREQIRTRGAARFLELRARLHGVARAR